MKRASGPIPIWANVRCPESVEYFARIGQLNPLETMKTLIFYFRGDEYRVNEAGQIKANGLPDHSPQWLFLGGSRHHWRRGIDVTLADAFEMPGLLNGCLGWDRDHGTVRRWGGNYYGRIPRIERAHIIENTTPKR